MKTDSPTLTRVVLAAIAALCLSPLAEAATAVSPPSYPAAYMTNPSSAWNTPIGAHATYTAIPVRLGGLDSWSGLDWAIPFYVASTATGATPMPLMYNSLAWTNVANGAWKRAGNTAQVEKQILASSTNQFPWPGNPYSSISTTAWVLPANFNRNVVKTSGPPLSFYYTTKMLPALASDGHMAVLQPNGTVIGTYGTIVLSSGVVVALSYAVTDPKGLCDGWSDGQTASMLPAYAGLLDDQEVQSGTIHHALAITIPGTLLTASSIAYPAYAFDRAAMRQTPVYSGTVPMGARLALPPSVTVSSLGLATPEGVAIAHAAQTYGFIVSDQGGNGIALRATANPSHPDPAIRRYNWPLQSDLNKIMARLARVS